jgi:nitric oxide reductase subunit C
MLCVEQKQFQELSISAKRAIFWALVLGFICYSALIYTTGTEYQAGQEAFSGSAQRGKLVFQKYNCISCHQIYGLGGYMGPDLTNVMEEEAKGRNYAEVFIQHGTAKMPRFEMTETERDELLNYLEYVGKAGSYPVTDFKVTWYGNIHSETAENEKQ